MAKAVPGHHMLPEIAAMLPERPHAPDLPDFLARVRACTACADLPQGPRPILQIDPRARILIASQAPGRKAHASGIPFDDASGDRLRLWLGVDKAAFYDPAKFAILPMGFCYPGTGASGDMPPRLLCARTWREQLLARLPEVQLTLVVGRHAMGWHLPQHRSTLTEAVAHWPEGFPATLALPHPSPRNNPWFKANPWFEERVLPELRSKVRALLG